MAVRYKGRNKKTGMFPYEEGIYKTRPKKKGVKYSYESTKLPYTVTKNYLPDFTVTLPSGKIFYIEVKGYFRYEDMSKMKSVLVNHPGIDIRMVFPSKHKKSIAWCTRNKVPYAIGLIPEEWLIE